MSEGGRELPTDWWMTDDVAAFLGVSGSTVRAYITRHQIPEPDRMFGRSPGWRPHTIEAWHASRPRKAQKRSVVDHGKAAGAR